MLRPVVIRRLTLIFAECYRHPVPRHASATQYALAWLFIKPLGALPGPLARAAAISLAWVVYFLHSRLRHVGMRNLALVFPQKTLPANAHPAR